MTRVPKMNKTFYMERTLYYKRLRDSTDNPELYVAYEEQMRYNFEKLKFFYKPHKEDCCASE